MKESVEGVLNKPEVADKIAEAKVKTVNVAEKAVGALKKWLRPEEDEGGEE